MKKMHKKYPAIGFNWVSSIQESELDRVCWLATVLSG
jgi:hypothetical protein